MAGISRHRVGRFGVVLVVSAALAGCAEDAVYRAPIFPFAGSYAGHKSGAPVLLENAAWWTGLKDPVLDTLVERALRDNLSLALATERVTEAQANLDAVPAAASLTPSAGIQRQKDAGGSPETRSEASLGLSWLLDPYGGRRQKIRAAGARIEAADAEKDAARLLLLRSLSAAYVDLRYYQQVLAVRHREIRSRRQTLRLTRTLIERNATTRLDLLRAEARLAETETAIPGVESAIRGQKYLIATLLGAAPGQLDIDLDSGVGQPLPRLAPDVGIPADLLRNRPDLRIAERLYYAAVADTGAARSNLYPSLSLSGTVNLAQVGDAAGTEYFFGPTLTLPALPSGSRQAQVAARDSQARQALTSWRSTVLDAIREVETALVDYSGNTATVSAARNSVRLYREAVTLTRDLVSRDAATIRELIDTEESAADSELALAGALRQQALSFVSLNVALGSGNAYGGGGTAAAE